MNEQERAAWLCAQAAAWGVTPDETMCRQLEAYGRLLRLWNERMNLTAIVEPDEIVNKHFLDSLSVAPLISPDASVVDVGTGAGFPGVPLKLLYPSLELTLLDSQQKRLHFLEILCQTLGISATRVHARAETAGRLPVLREQFDVATARAVAALPVLCEYCLPLVRVGGRFVAMKGPDGEKEAIAAQKAATRLGGRLEEVRRFSLPNDGGERTLIVYQKAEATPADLPRPTAKIAKGSL